MQAEARTTAKAGNPDRSARMPVPGAQMPDAGKWALGSALTPQEKYAAKKAERERVRIEAERAAAAELYDQAQLALYPWLGPSRARGQQRRTTASGFNGYGAVLPTPYQLEVAISKHKAAMEAAKVKKEKAEAQFAEWQQDRAVDVLKDAPDTDKMLSLKERIQAEQAREQALEDKAAADAALAQKLADEEEERRRNAPVRWPPRAPNAAAVARLQTVETRLEVLKMAAMGSLGAIERARLEGERQSLLPPTSFAAACARAVLGVDGHALPLHLSAPPLPNGSHAAEEVAAAAAASVGDVAVKLARLPLTVDPTKRQAVLQIAGERYCLSNGVYGPLPTITGGAACHSLFQVQDKARLELTDVRLLHAAEEQEEQVEKEEAGEVAEDPNDSGAPLGRGPSSVGAAIMLNNKGSAGLRRCEVESSHGIGLWLVQKSRAQVVGCSLGPVGRSGAALFGQSEATIMQSLMRKCGAHGVCARGRSTVTVVGCRFEENGRRGAYVYEGATMALSSCHVSGTLDAERAAVEGGGMRQGDGCILSLRKVTIRGNAGVGLRLRGRVMLQSTELSFAPRPASSSSGANVEADANSLVQYANTGGDMDITELTTSYSPGIEQIIAAGRPRSSEEIEAQAKRLAIEERIRKEDAAAAIEAEKAARYTIQQSYTGRHSELRSTGRGADSYEHGQTLSLKVGRTRLDLPSMQVFLANEQESKRASRREALLEAERSKAYEDSLNPGST